MWKLVIYLLFNLCNAYNAPQYTHNIAKDNFKLVPYFAKPIIRRNRLTRHQCDELIQEGYIGLMYAARKYDRRNHRPAPVLELGFAETSHLDVWDIIREPERVKLLIERRGNPHIFDIRPLESIRAPRNRRNHQKARLEPHHNILHSRVVFK